MCRPVRVLQVLTCDDVGGTEHMVASLVESLDPTAVHCTVVTLDDPGPIAARLAHSGVPVRSLGARGLARAFWRLAGILGREPYDVVNAYGFKSTAVTRVLVRLLARGTRFVSGVRGLHVSELERLDGPKSRFVLAVERRLAPLVDVYDSNSLGAIELLAGAGVPRDRMCYIPNGLDPAAWDVHRADPPAASPPMVLTVARFVPRKRHVDLVRAAHHLDRQGVELRLVLAGDGPELPTIRDMLSRLDLQSRVELIGSVDREAVRGLLAEARVFCLPSLWEGMAGSVMEAMACGLPVVGTCVVGIADLVEDGRTGLLVPPEHPDRLARALAQLLASPEDAAAMGRAGRRRLEENFGLEEMVSAKRRLYERLAAH